jgi:flavodoxin
MIIFHGNSMNRVIILYAPDTPELTQAADKIKRALAPEDFNVEVKASKQGSIQDLAASDLIIAGFKDAKKWPHPDFAEINRALSGINLAGRVAGVFGTDTDGMIENFRKSFSDSDITIYADALTVGNREQDVRLMSAWIKNFVALYKEGLHAREV